MIRSKEMTLFRPLVKLLAACVLLVPQLNAQNYTPQKLLFTGADNYKTADLVAVTGLTPGKPVTAAEIDVAMQHLVDTGLFREMRYTVDGKALTFALTEVASDQLLPARYTNLVWWKPEELTPLVHARIPLFTGSVPVTGTMKEQIAAALSALVLEKGVKADVTSLVYSKSLGGANLGLGFSISQPVVEIGEVRVDGVSTGAESKVSVIKRRFAGQEYDVFETGPALSRNLSDAYLDLGYLDITVDPLAHGAPQISAMAITIDVSTTAHEGAVYHVSQMVWPESGVVPKSVLADVAQLKRGDPASRIMLLSTISKVGDRYAAAGYLDAKVSVEPQKDEAQHQIAYTFGVVPGEQYRVGSVKAENLNAEQQAEFDRNWKLAPGDVYNQDIARASVFKMASARAFQGFTPKMNRVADPATHLVAVTVSFVRAGSRPS
jgi:outer membrane protein insertion porin family